MITKIHGLYVTLPIYTLMLLLVQQSMSIPRHIYSATRDPLFSIVTENVANASLEPIMVRSSEVRNLASGRAAHGDRLQNVFVFRTYLWRREWSRRYCSPACHMTLSHGQFNNHLLLRCLLFLLFLLYQSLQKTNQNNYK